MLLHTTLPALLPMPRSMMSMMSMIFYLAHARARAAFLNGKMV
jgi:hypothetical protein